MDHLHLDLKAQITLEWLQTAASLWALQIAPMGQMVQAVQMAQMGQMVQAAQMAQMVQIALISLQLKILLL